MTVFELGGRGAFHAVEFGPRDAPPLIWLHGFPDHPLTAVPFLQLLAKSRRVIAPWLRGYAPSPLLGPFDMENLVADILALIDSLEAQQVDLVGHDWGAAITYATCAAAPQRVRRAVTLALPHPLTFLHMLKTGAQMRRSWYMALFQIPGSERLVLAKETALLDHLWRTWSPKFELDEARRRTLHACLVASLPAPLGYYRAMVRPLARARGFPPDCGAHPPKTATVGVSSRSTRSTPPNHSPPRSRRHRRPERWRSPEPRTRRRPGHGRDLSTAAKS